MLSKKSKLLALGTTLVLAPVLTLTPVIANINTSIQQALNYGDIANGKTAVAVAGADLSKCQAGKVDAKTMEAVIATINSARELNGLQGIVELPALSEYAQAGSMYLARNKVLTHELNSKNPCFTATGEAAAKHAVLSMSSKDFSAQQLTNILLSDDRDNDKLGNRLQVLNPKLAKTGIGIGLSENQDAYLSVLTLNGYSLTPKTVEEAKMSNTGAVTPELITWPALGNFPHSLLPISKTDHKNTWSASVKGDFSGAVKVTVSGPNGEVAVKDTAIIAKANEANLPGYTTVAFQMPNDLPKPANVDAYRVSVSIGAKTVKYEVKLVAPGAKDVAPVIVEQPKLDQVTADKAVKTQIVAAGKNLKYAWQVSADGGKDWSNLTDTSGKELVDPAQEFVFAEAAHGSLLRVVVTSGAGLQTISDTVKVEVAGVAEKDAKAKAEADAKAKAEADAKAKAEADAKAKAEADAKAKAEADAKAKAEADAKAKVQPVATLNTSEVRSGGWVVIKASGFTGNETVSGEFHSKVIKFGQTSANAAGEITWKVSTKGLEPGSHHIVLKGMESGKTIEIPLQIKDDLPTTGVSVISLFMVIALGIIILGLGILLMVFLRRRRQEEEVTEDTEDKAEE